MTLPILELTPSEAGRLPDLHRDYPEGVTVRLGQGQFVLDRTIILGSGMSLVGQGAQATEICLAPGSNCHVFTNADHKGGNSSIAIRSLRVSGNRAHQVRPEGLAALSFACGFYAKGGRGLLIEDCAFLGIRQTALHFNECEGITVRNVTCREMGWSGLSTSNASDMNIDIDVFDSGLDVMHSGIHLDGGVGILCRATIEDSTGNGIMLDSAYSPLRNVVVRGTARRCKRGVSLSGSAEAVLQDVMIEGDFSDNREIGVMVSNSDHVFLSRCRIVGNGEIGLLMQGRNGGNSVTCVDCTYADQPVDISEVHASARNWIIGDAEASGARSNARSLEAHRGDATEHRRMVSARRKAGG